MPGEFTRIHGRILPLIRENSSLFGRCIPLNQGEFTRIFGFFLLFMLMPYTNDPRRTVTLNLHADEYAALADDALEAGYKTPGTYALALVRARGDAPAPILDERTDERMMRLEGKNEWLLHQFEALQAKLQAAGIPFKLVSGPNGQPRPRSWAAQDRAVDTAVDRALEQDKTRRARQAAKRAAARAADLGPA